jgi:uncharacterized SAM-binding protein YcdF (DUF218 family)
MVDTMTAFAREAVTLLLPPGLFALLWLIGLVILRWSRRVGVWLCATTLVLFYLASIPIVAGTLIGGLESYRPLTEQDLASTDGQAIVILSAGRRPQAPEYGGDTVTCKGLERLRYGAYLHRQTGLPILVSGGASSTDSPSFARLMADILTRDYGISEIWLEEGSLSTWENAELTRPVLQDHEVEAIYLVTHAWHMPRAVECFEEVGLRVIPASTAYAGTALRSEGSLGWLPSVSAMSATNWACHEWIGRLWYRIRYFD